jgi:hypothetical protein
MENGNLLLSSNGFFLKLVSFVQWTRNMYTIIYDCRNDCYSFRTLPF